MSDTRTQGVLGDTIPGHDSQRQYQQDQQQQQQQHVPIPVPPSPTLTNPDMILPVDEGERESSTPSPPFRLPSLSHLEAFYGNQQQQQQLLRNELSAGDSNASIGVAVTYSNGSQQKKSFPRHMSSWTTQDPSRRLSDIGEEDTSSLKGSQVDGNGLEEWDSSSSGSTVGTAGERGQQNGHGVSRGANGNGAPVVETFPSAILSSEAERILENAKKRLTLMEGNLNRARSSMRLSPSISPSPSSSGRSSPLGLHQPVGGLYRSISSRTDRKVSPLRPRPTRGNGNKSSEDGGNNRHSRVHSETNMLVNSSTQTEQLSRSVSAMGSTDTPSFRNDDRSFRYEPTRPYLLWRTPASTFQTRKSEGDKQSVSNQSTPPLVISPEPDDNSKTHFANMEEFNAAHPSRTLTRTQSQLQVRDLQDQMKGLHIKISSLKVKTQEDNIRRRSFQHLRDSSPYATSDQWYASATESRDRSRSPSIISTGQGWISGRAEEAPHKEEEHTKQYEAPKVVDSNLDNSAMGDSPEQTDFEDSTEYDDGRASAMESLYEDAEEGDYDDTSEVDSEALDEILNEPFDGSNNSEDTSEAFPPVPQSAVDSRPHEEREDAFDYEHFILHSALGNYSRAKLRRSSGSSTSSAATTRPTHDQSSSLAGLTVGRSRANSATSISTVATFTTATEGEHDDDGDDIESVLYWDRKFNNELGIQQEYVESGDAIRKPAHTAKRQPSRTENITSQSPPTIGSATTSLASSLVSTVKAASKTRSNASAGSGTGSTTNGTSGINNDDTRLLEQLFNSLGKVCMDLQAITTSPNHDPKAARVLRRRLDAARRVLDGELDA